MIRVLVTQPGRTALHVVVVDRLEVGRDCDGLLLADQRVSRRHLALELVDGRMVVADLGSSNGTFVDGMRVRSPVVLEPYSTVTLGATSIRLVLPEDIERTAGRASAAEGAMVPAITGGIGPIHTDTSPAPAGIGPIHTDTSPAPAGIGPIHTDTSPAPAGIGPIRASGSAAPDPSDDGLGPLPAFLTPIRR